jgi:hypothetical protein
MMQEGETKRFSSSPVGLPREIFIPLEVAREIQREATGNSSESEKMPAQYQHHSIQVGAISRLPDHNIYQQPHGQFVSHGYYPRNHNPYHHDVDSRIVSSGRRRQMSDPIPISRNSDDAYVHDERQLHFEQQQLRNRYNDATWKLYRYIRAAKLSLRMRRETHGEQDEEIQTNAGQSASMSAALGQEQEVEQNVRNDQERHQAARLALEEMSQSRNEMSHGNDSNSQSGPYCCIFDLDW